MALFPDTEQGMFIGGFQNLGMGRPAMSMMQGMERKTVPNRDSAGYEVIPVLG